MLFKNITNSNVFRVNKNKLCLDFETRTWSNQVQPTSQPSLHYSHSPITNHISTTNSPSSINTSQPINTNAKINHPLNSNSNVFNHPLETYLSSNEILLETNNDISMTNHISSKVGTSQNHKPIKRSPQNHSKVFKNPQNQGDNEDNSLIQRGLSIRKPPTYKSLLRCDTNVSSIEDIPNKTTDLQQVDTIHTGNGPSVTCSILSSSNLQSTGILQSADNLQSASNLHIADNIQSSGYLQSAGNLQPINNLQKAGNLQSAGNHQSVGNLYKAGHPGDVVKSSHEKTNVQRDQDIQITI